MALQLVPAADAKFAVNGIQVGLHGIIRDAQPGGDLHVGEAGFRQAGHFALAPAQAGFAAQRCPAPEQALS